MPSPERLMSCHVRVEMTSVGGVDVAHDCGVPDPIFADPRLADLYDVLDDDRGDLDVYVRIVEELGAASVLDVGCGTGTLACMLAGGGVKVIGLDPAAASLAVARTKPGAAAVEWIHGSASEAPAVGVDLAVMTGNVAQVFVSDVEWQATLQAIRNALKPGGWFVFESRDPAAQAWKQWTPESTSREVDVVGVGRVVTWTELVDVALPFVTFRHVFRFDADGVEMTSTSTLRFRSRQEIEVDLVRTGFRVDEVRDAPDRPGKEFVFLARKDG